MTDLRIIKTKRNIREAFWELRKENGLEKIKVTRICELALINKTTFYNHYQDIYALSDEIENETILSIMTSFQHMDILYSNPEAFMRGLYATFKSHEDEILTLFSGRMSVLIEKVEKQLTVQYPQLNDTPQKEILLSFLVWGAFHVLGEAKYEENLLLDTLTQVARQIIAAMGTSHLSG